MFFQVDIVAVVVVAVVAVVVVVKALIAQHQRVLTGKLNVRVMTKALRSVIIIKFSIKIRVGTSFLQKYKFDFDAIYSVYTE